MEKIWYIKRWITRKCRYCYNIIYDKWITWKWKKTSNWKIWNITNKVLIIIEPGTPNGFKNILTARNLLIEKGANILAPCVHKGKCEIKEDDWCGFSARVARSGLHRLAKKGELSYEDEKFSYIVFSKDDTNIKGERILRHPQIGKGFIKIKTCSQKGIEEKVITKKQGEIYKKLKKQNAGDLINNDWKNNKNVII